MEEYTVLEFDYGDSEFQDMDLGERLAFASQKTNSLSKLYETDPILHTLCEKDKEMFLAFVWGLHACAAGAQAEFSLALCPEENSASVVIVTKDLDLQRPLSFLVSTSMLACDRVVIEPIEENGSKLMLYLSYSFDH